jgi:hypothetical protein
MADIFSISAADPLGFTVPPLDTAGAANLDSIAPGVTDIVAQQQQPGETWADTLGRVIPLILGTAQQAQLLQVQVDRAKKGLPPLNASQYAAGVNVGLAPQTQTFVYVALAAVVGLFVLPRLLK